MRWLGQQRLGHVDRKGQYARSVLHRGLNPCRKRAALRALTGTGSADNAVLDDLTLDLHLDRLASLQVQVPVNGMITHWSG